MGNLLFLTVLFCGVSILWQPRVVEAADKPNIVFILADDMGLWAAGTYGNPEIVTPNIDKLAEEGIKFNNAFCNTPVCSASRSSYFTGIFVISNYSKLSLNNNEHYFWS